jgi:transcription elongation factor GreA
MSSTPYLITKEAIELLRDELRQRQSMRYDLAERIDEARRQGDISENAEYDAAREEQGLNEAKIALLEDKLGRAKVVDTALIAKDKIYFGSRFKATNLITDQKLDFQIVSEDEVNAKIGKISNNSPLAKEFLGKTKGDCIAIETPKGDEIEYKITKII